ncbi:hypothetical protein IFM89_022843 [Coptis chinensis]|uniref:Uncharacterized protein n=1 Tax=Coptis chinensis TaxID=261450 RepID=A0A835IXT5_9MAGN|nr:hypothetical protein IFM89_022843 [Coptis chinensis]
MVDMWVSMASKEDSSKEISPLWFALVEDTLCRVLHFLREKTHLKPLMTIIKKLATPSHLIFVYDFIIFTNGEIRGIRKLSHILQRYQKAAGQFISQAKSKVLFSTFSHLRKQDVLLELNMVEGYMPEKYLGVSLHQGRVTRTCVTPILDNIKKKLTSWKGNKLLFSRENHLDIISSL